MSIAVGSDPAIFVTNLFYFYYEDRRIEKIKRNDIFIARKFGSTFLFTDDLAAISDRGKFEKVISENWNSN